MSSINDLNNILFSQLNRLNNNKLSEDELKNEAVRAKAITDVSSKVLESAHVTIQATKIINEYGPGRTTDAMIKLTSDKQKG